MIGCAWATVIGEYAMLGAVLMAGREELRRYRRPPSDAATEARAILRLALLGFVAGCAAVPHRDETLPLFVGSNAFRIGTRGFRADVDNVCPLLLEFKGPGVGAIGVEVTAAVREGVRGGVENPEE